MNPLQKKINDSIAFILGIGIGLILSKLGQYNDLSETKQNGVTQTEKGYFLVSVLAANKFLDTRAKAVYETWAKNYKNVLFFSQSKKVDTELPVIFLPGTDDSYPPQRKSFTMLKFLYENYLDSYEWFIRADDDVYIKLDRLRIFLNQFDPRKVLYIGQPGMEHSPESPFCMGGPGIILSREALKRVGPHLNSCYKNLIQTEHEDVEFGRCIKKFLNISCTSSYEMKSLFYQLHDGKNDSLVQHPDLYVFKKTISIHPLKQSDIFYFIHLNELKNKEQALRDKLFELKNSNSKIFDNGFKNLKYFDSYNIYDFDTEHVKLGLQSDLKILTKSLNEETTEKIFKNNLEFIRSTFMYGYFDIDSSDNFHFIFNNEIKHLKNNKLSSSIQNLKIEVPFLDYSINNETIDNEITINFILALCNRLNTFKVFIKNFYENILKSPKNTRLIMVICNSDLEEVRNITKELILTKRENSLVFLGLNQNFNKGFYLNHGSKAVPDNEIIFFIDVDFLFYSDILDRIRLNTRLNYQVYMPICFSIFKHSPFFNDNSNLINPLNGEWRHFGFGAISIFKKDFLRTGFNESINGWGKEDVDVAEKIMNLNEMKIFRAVDYSIIHLFHIKICDDELPNDQFVMCLKSKIRALGMKGLKENLN